MKRNLINAQLTNYVAYQMYFRQGLTLAENVFKFKNLPESIDESYMNSCLVRKGAIVFFKDEIMGFLALPFRNEGKLDVYGRPERVTAFSQNGYVRHLKKGEFVIMYDNQGHFPIYIDIQQYALRVAMQTRISDINIQQQKTPRVWKIPQDKLVTFQNAIEEIDGYCESVLTYDDTALNDSDSIIAPAPFVADKIRDEKNETWNEMLRYIGISNVQVQKKERLITDEVAKMQGGTIAMRESRFKSREIGCQKIKDMFGIDLKVEFYDGIPSNEKEELPEFDEDFGGDENESI